MLLQNQPVDKNADRVDILLATYNGEKYLREQLDSILSQTHGHWRIVARDDGSSDRTVEILKEYEARIKLQFGDGRMVILEGPANKTRDAVMSRKNRNRRVIENFEALMQWSLKDGHASYAAFCDQDDKWYPHKIAKTLAAIHELELAHGKDTPLLVHSDVRLVYKDGHIQYGSLKHLHRQRPELSSFHNELIENMMQGCTIMLNPKLMALSLPIPEQAEMHDAWVGLVAGATGKCGYVNEPLLDYRQHSQNVSNSGHMSSYAPSSKIAVVKKLLHKPASLRAGIEASVLQAQALYRHVGNNATPETRRTLETFLDISANPHSWQRGVKYCSEGFTPPVLRKRSLALFGGNGGIPKDKSR